MTERDKKREQIDALTREFNLTWTPWQKKVKLVYDIHTIFQSLDNSWTQKDTAEYLDYSFDHISESCRLAQALQDEDCKEIYNIKDRNKAIAYVRKVKKWKRL